MQQAQRAEPAKPRPFSFLLLRTWLPSCEVAQVAGGEARPAENCPPHSGPADLVHGHQPALTGSRVQEDLPKVPQPRRLQGEQTPNQHTEYEGQ